jgi:hypothetical protein
VPVRRSHRVQRGLCGLRGRGELTGEWRTGSDRELHGLMWSALRANREGGVAGYVA